MMVRSGERCRRSTRRFEAVIGRWPSVVATLVGVAWSAGAVIAAPSFDEQLTAINADAREARESGELEIVEKKRRERWQLIGQFAGQKNPPDSPWIAAYRALEKVDGSESSTEESTGILNELKYKESCDVLKKAFDEMAAEGKGPLLGELATRYFEVAQQAKGVYRDALVAGSPDQVADVADITNALQIAKERDPCCVAAVAMLLYLEKPDPKETFLRAEVRSSFRKRQKQLVDLSHPLVLPSLPSQTNWLPIGDEDDNGNPNEQPGGAKPIENANVAVMPWHAAVELDKAMSLQFILKDLEYTRPLTPDFPVTIDVALRGPDNKPILEPDGKTPKTVPYPLYTSPSQVFAGVDAELSPCRLLYGKILFARLAEGGGSRSVAYFPVANPAKKKVEWDYRYLDVIYRVPTAEELDKSPTMKRKHEFITVYAPRVRWKVGDEVFHLYDFPVRDAERCLQFGMQVFCVRSKDDFPKIKFMPLKNKADVVSKLETALERQFPQSSKMPFATTQLVRFELLQYSLANDPTKHALIELLRGGEGEEDDANYLNPLMLVSERKSGGGAVQPNLFAGDGRDEPPYVLLDEGGKLHFSLSGLPESPCCLIRNDGATAYFPLVETSIPKPILLGSDIGKAFVGVLVKAGYTEQQAVAEIERAMVTNDYMPDKFRQAVDARFKAEKADAFKKGDPGAVSAANKESVCAAMLREVGWYGSPQLKPALEQMFGKYGFRYLRDKRNNWILVRELMEEDGSGTSLLSPGLGLKEELPEERRMKQAKMDAETALLPYAYMAQDGKRSIDAGQIYSWTAYQQLKDSIYGEHLRKVLAFHPCLAAIDLIDADSNDRLQHPSEHKPEYMKKFQASAQKVAAKGGATGGGGVASYGEIPDLRSPFPAWVVGEDGNQQKSLAALHGAYQDKLIALSVEARNMSDASTAYRFYEQLYLAANTRASLIESLGGMRAAGKAFYNATTARQDAVKSLRVVQLESGRNYARRKYFHKSIVWYNDLLSQLVSGDQRASRVRIFTEVPTTDTAAAFVDNLRGLIEGQSFVLNTQVELAGVLNASGLKPSAQFVWQRTIDDYDFFLRPAVEIARDLMESYGLRMSDRAERTLESLDDTVGLCRDAIAKYGLSVDWRKIEAAGGKALVGEAKRRRTAAAVRSDLERDNEGKLTGPEREKLEKDCEAISADKSIGFAEWLEWKKALLELRPTLAFRTTWFSPPWLACPLSYDPETGFGEANDAAKEVILKADLPAILAWIKKPVDEANKDSIAGDASAILGWYWLDGGQLPAARAAFMNLARIKVARAKERGGSLEGLLDELHAFAALTAAGSIVESMPGLSAFKTDFGGLLEGQLSSWEKRWFADGHYGPHASQQRVELLSRAAQVQRQLASMSRAWRRNRYYFPDYSFEFGAVPDFLVEKLLDTPELFKPLTDAEVKAREDKAVEGNKWVVVNKQEGKNFMEKFPLKEAVEEDIVFLGK
jgi:hypothetical protein